MSEFLPEGHNISSAFLTQRNKLYRERIEPYVGERGRVGFSDYTQEPSSEILPELGFPEEEFPNFELRRNPTETRMRALERQVSVDPGDLDSQTQLAVLKRRIGLLPTVILEPRNELLVDRYGFDPWGGLGIFPRGRDRPYPDDAKESLLAHFGLYTHAIPGVPYPPAYIRRTEEIRQRMLERGRYRLAREPIKRVPDRAYYYTELMQLKEGGGVVMTLLLDNDELLDIIWADVPSVITGGAVYWGNNPNPRVRDFIRHIYETGETEWLVFDIQPLNPELWESYQAIR
jgi:hypothetical protein